MITDEEITALQAEWESERRLEPFCHALGPPTAKIVLVGEAWGQHEKMWRSPFVWAAGIELARMLSDAELTEEFVHPRASGRAAEPHMIEWWKRSGLLLTNVFAERPPDNNLDFWCGKKKEIPEGPMIPLKTGKYLHPAFYCHVERLHAELNATRPNLVVALGNTACWAILQQTNIASIRGTVTWSKQLNLKVLPTFHPAAVMRDWSLRPIVVTDLMKAKREGEFPEIRRPSRRLIISPTLEDIWYWASLPATHYAVDIETKNRQITMIGFARGRADALVIPFVKADGSSYWPTLHEERQARQAAQCILGDPAVKIFQNGLYDLSYLVKEGFHPKNCLEDTMLLHHSIFPEMRKGLGFLGSIYSDEVAWKLLAKHKPDDMNKREE